MHFHGGDDSEGAAEGVRRARAGRSSHKVIDPESGIAVAGRPLSQPGVALSLRFRANLLHRPLASFADLAG